MTEFYFFGNGEGVRNYGHLKMGINKSLGRQLFCFYFYLSMCSSFIFNFLLLYLSVESTLLRERDHAQHKSHLCYYILISTGVDICFAQG